jgi:hypothetical protein
MLPNLNVLGIKPILVAANNVRPQYKFDLYIQGTSTLVNTSGLITASNQFLF